MADHHPSVEVSHPACSMHSLVVSAASGKDGSAAIPVRCSDQRSQRSAEPGVRGEEQPAEGAGGLIAGAERRSCVAQCSTHKQDRARFQPVL